MKLSFVQWLCMNIISQISEKAQTSLHILIQKVLPEGSDFDNVFFSYIVNEVRDDPNTTISGPTSTRQRNAI